MAFGSVMAARSVTTRFECASQISSSVALGAACGDGITENQGTDAPYTMGLVHRAANFNFAKDGKQFWRRDLRNRGLPRWGKMFLAFRSITSLA